MENFDTSWATLKRGKVLRACTSTLAAIFIMTSFGASSSALAQGEGGGQVDLVTQSQNPIASLISLPFDFNNYQNVGEDEKTQHILLAKPVVPIDITENWNFVLRALIPFIDQPDSGPIDGKTGVGDIQLQTYFVPKKTDSLGGDNFWTWGVGPVLQFDSASDDILGTGRNAAGIGGVLFGKINNWTVGALLNNVWDVDSSKTREDVNSMTFQPFVNYNLDNGWYLKTDPVITYNQKADSGNKWTVPVGGGFGRVVNWGKQAVKWSVSAYGYADSPDGGANALVQVSFVFLFPK
jgi:hypothetical protein